MALALSLGRRTQGQTSPNPAVGCVIVLDGRIVGRGWTAVGGRPHAEVNALAQAGPLAKGATAFVTLEPCAHHGETPPCAQALIDAGVARVVCAVEDTDARVSGRGFEMLRAAGVAVETGLMAEAAYRDLSGFLRVATGGLPHVTLKIASSFDGRIATGSGQSQWITGPDARRMVHAMRHSHDAVMVGGGTARADDPSLTVREMGDVRQPVRVVLSRRLDIPLSGQLAQTAGDVPVWLCHGRDVDPYIADAWRGLGASLIECAPKAGQIDPRDALLKLGQAGLTRVFCEGGSALAASLLTAGLVDDLIGFTAGFSIGAEGLPAIGALGLADLNDARRFKLVRTQAVGADVMHHWTRA